MTGLARARRRGEVTCRQVAVSEGGENTRDWRVTKTVSQQKMKTATALVWLVKKFLMTWYLRIRQERQEMTAARRENSRTVILVLRGTNIAQVFGPATPSHSMAASSDKRGLFSLLSFSPPDCLQPEKVCTAAQNTKTAAAPASQAG